MSSVINPHKYSPISPERRDVKRCRVAVSPQTSDSNVPMRHSGSSIASLHAAPTNRPAQRCLAAKYPQIHEGVISAFLDTHQGDAALTDAALADFLRFEQTQPQVPEATRGTKRRSSPSTSPIPSASMEPPSDASSVPCENAWATYIVDSIKGCDSIASASAKAAPMLRSIAERAVANHCQSQSASASSGDATTNRRLQRYIEVFAHAVKTLNERNRQLQQRVGSQDAELQAAKQENARMSEALRRAEHTASLLTYRQSLIGDSSSRDVFERRGPDVF